MVVKQKILANSDNTSEFMRSGMKKGKIIYSGPELNKMRKAWRDLTSMRDLPPGRDSDKFTESIFLLHEAIKVRCEDKAEEIFCHRDLYGRFLMFVSQDYDRSSSRRTVTDSYKYSCLPGWCNKFDRVHRFILHCLACYEKGEEIETVSELQPHYESVYIDDKVHHFLIEDQFGRYFYNPKTFEVVVVEFGVTAAISLSDFSRFVRPKAHKVGIKYIVRRLKVIEYPTKQQLRFIRKFAEGNSKSVVLSGKNNRSKKRNNRRVPKVWWSGAGNGQKSEDETRETN